MGKSYADPFTRANGALGSIPSGPAWTVLSGSVAISSNRALFSTAPGSNPLAVVDVGLRSNGHGDVDVSAKPNHHQGNALYVRVQDASNWVRARLNYRQTSYQYYVTEYQHISYGTEWYYWDFVMLYQYQPKKLQRQVITRTYGAWDTGWPDTGVTTGCRDDTLPPPDPQAPVVDSYGNNVQEFRWWPMSDANSGCNATRTMYKEESRGRTYTDTNSWVDDGYSLGANQQFSGNTQVVNNGSTYYNYTGTANGPYDTLVSSGGVHPANGVGGSYDYWSSTAPSGGYYPGSNPADQWSGDTRTVVTGSYWDTTYEAGAPTRQVGPYTGYNYYRDVVLEKCVAGTVTVLDTGSGQATSALRVRAVGSNLQVFINGSGTALLSVTDSTHIGQGKVGIGGGTSDYSPSNPDWDDFVVTVLHAELVRIGGVWVSGTGWKVHNGAGWVEYETKVK